jgi:hypothetical protein
VGISCIWPRAVSIALLFITINLNNKAYPILDGGDNLMQILFVYLVFIDPNAAGKSEASPSAGRALIIGLSNYALLMARLQIVFVYVIAGLAKVRGPLWQNGTALYYTLNVEEYSLPFFADLISAYPLLAVLGTYSTILYQLAFPWLIWNPKIKPALLTFGTFLHLQISFVMGLFSFGLAVTASYVSFYSDAQSERLGRLLSRPYDFVTTLKLPSRLVNYRRGAPRSVAQ